jgi:hypothetical protein
MAITTVSTAEEADLAPLEFDVAGNGPPRRATSVQAPSAHIPFAALALLRELPLQATEDVVRRSMDLYDPPATFDEMKAFREFLQTATIFALDIRDTRAAFDSEPPAGLGLPRLPSRRAWVEWHEFEVVHARGPIPLLQDRETRGEHDVTYDLLGIGIAEIEPGVCWDVYWPCQEIEWVLNEPAVAINVRRWRVTADALADVHSSGPAEAKKLIDLAMTAADVITARNVPHERLQLPRQQRKQFRREQRGGDHQGGPEVYYVNLRRAGEGQGDRSEGPRYRRRVRWFVRGHWRTYRSGLVTWVRPHVRGPVGAPWKGRPLYHT